MKPFCIRQFLVATRKYHLALSVFKSICLTSSICGVVLVAKLYMTFKYALKSAGTRFQSCGTLDDKSVKEIKRFLRDLKDK